MTDHRRASSTDGPAHAALGTAAPESRAKSSTGVIVRRLRPTDSLEELTRLLHRAYARQVSMGLHALASHQSPEVTRRRVSKGECFVAVAPGASQNTDASNAPGFAVDDGRAVGTIMFQEPSWGSAPASGPRWFQRPDVSNFSMFAVEPTLQGQGVGVLLLAHVEARARELGVAELALSTAEPDTKLVAFYRNRGFREVERFDWGVTNYTSLIMSKSLTRPNAPG
jgi:GNAT superfamily N-acetyltransferase